MPLTTYGVLKGTVVGHLRDADDDHYQILVQAGNTLHRIATNVKSSAPKAPSIVLFLSTTTLPQALTDRLTALDVWVQGATLQASQVGSGLSAQWCAQDRLHEARSSRCARS